jgi:hypothetical protein
MVDLRVDLRSKHVFKFSKAMRSCLNMVRDLGALIVKLGH